MSIPEVNRTEYNKLSELERAVMAVDTSLHSGNTYRCPHCDRTGEHNGFCIHTTTEGKYMKFLYYTVHRDYDLAYRPSESDIMGVCERYGLTFIGYASDGDYINHLYDTYEEAWANAFMGTFGLLEPPA